MVGAAVLALQQDSRVHGVPNASNVGVHTEFLRNALKRAHAMLGLYPQATEDAVWGLKAQSESTSGRQEST